MQNNDNPRRDCATSDNYERLQKQFEELKQKYEQLQLQKQLEELKQKYEQLLQATDAAQTVPVSVAELSLDRTGTEPVVGANVDAPSNDIPVEDPFDSLESDEGYFNQISDEDRECFDGDFDGTFDAVGQSLSLNAQIKEEVDDFDAPICFNSPVLENDNSEYSPETITPTAQPGFQHNTADIDEQTSNVPTYRQPVGLMFAHHDGRTNDPTHEELPSPETSTLSFQPGSPDKTADGDENELSEIDAEEEKIFPPNKEDESTHLNKNTCKLCGKSYQRRASYSDHILVCGKVCSICNKHYAQGSVFRLHAIKYHERRDWKSLLLPISRDQLTYQRVGTKGEGFKCSRCSYVLKTPEGLRRHEMGHDVDITIPCEMCSMTFLSKERYYRHKAGVHAPKKTLVCTICGKTYTKTLSFRHHMASHENKRLHKCLVCGKGFNFKNHLKHHTWSHNVGRTFPCDICGKLYKSEHSMDCHRRYSHHDNTFKCEICRKEFKIKRIRDRHQLMHAVWDAKKANLVNNTSAITIGKNSASLDQFVNALSDQRTCPFCHKVFKAKHTFKGHLKLCGKCCRLCHKRIEHPHHFRSHALKKHEVTDWESLLRPCQQGEISNSDMSNGKVAEAGSLD